MRRILPVFLFVAALLVNRTPVIASHAISGPIDFNVLDVTVEAQIAKHGLPGVALAVVEGDEIVYLKGYGLAGADRPMTPQTPMFIGSQSKSFTALAIAQLAEQGKLDLNAPVQTYIPWFQVADADASARITVNHLLHHISGLSESGYSVLLPADATLEDAVRSLAHAHLTAPVGTKHQYFNLGYDALATIVEQVSGQRYADYLQDHVFGPLGMASSTAKPDSATGLAQGYTRLFGFALPMRQVVRDYEIGAGYIVSTAEDLARYAIAMQNGGASLISPELAQNMFTPGLGGYGMGWMVGEGGAKIYHGGANEAFRTEVNLYPRRDRAFVLLTNEGHQVDHFVSATQLTASVEAVVLGQTPPPVEQGVSVRWIGWALGIIVVALLVLHTRNFLGLRGWRARAQAMAPGRKTWDVAISFIIPTVILIIVLSQVKSFYGYRFNPLTTAAYFRLSLPDVFILMLIGTLPDFAQGVTKLSWVLMGQTQPSVNTRTYPAALEKEIA